MKFSTNDLTDICEVQFPRILKFPNNDVMAAIFALFLLGHSHSRNFAPIFFKIGGEVESCLPLFAIENQRDRLVTSANMADRV